jgi:hypothetical protein
MTNTHRKLVWLVKSGAAGDCFFVEDYEIGDKTFAHHSLITETNKPKEQTPRKGCIPKVNQTKPQRVLVDALFI